MYFTSSILSSFGTTNSRSYPMFNIPEIFPQRDDASLELLIKFCESRNPSVKFLKADIYSFTYLSTPTFAPDLYSTLPDFSFTPGNPASH